MIPKFRAWFDAKMYDEPVVYSEEVYLDWRDFIDGRTFEDTVLMQSTGLLDKNGKEIFEGDVVGYVEDGEVTSENVLIKFGQHQNMDSSFDGVIHIGFYIDVQKGTATFDVEDMYNSFKDNIEIIGNIFENPELRKEVEV